MSNLFEKIPGGFRIWRLEFFIIKTSYKSKREFELTKGQCGCTIVSLYFFGVTWLGNVCYDLFEKKWDGYE